MNKLLLFIFLTTLGFGFDSIVLEKNYYVHDRNITLKDIIPTAKQNPLLFTIRPNKHMLRISRKKLLLLLKEYGYTASSRYSVIQFNKKSNINLAPIQKKIEEYFLSYYPSMQIYYLQIHPRTYIKKLPNSYTLRFRKKAYLFSKGILTLRADKRDYFFNYTLHAKTDVLTTRRKIAPRELIRPQDLQKTVVVFEHFKALPLQNFEPKKYEAKHQIPANSILTYRDIQKVYVVKRGQRVGVDLINGGIIINFSAKAIQNGRVSDIITIQKADGTKLRAVVVGKNKVEIR